MNLIEQYGSYNAAILKRHINYLNDTVDVDLINTLLQHRRENNIFEVGDLVVDDLSPSAMLMMYGDGCENYFILRHATDAEIEAGYRL